MVMRNTSQDLYYLIYRSSQTRELTVPELNRLVLNAQVFNKKKDITGLLIKLEDNYIQYIEGKKNNIVMLYEKLLRDDRHHSLQLLKKGDISARRFAHWSMELKHVTAEQIVAIEANKNLNTGFKLKNNVHSSSNLNLAMGLIKNFETAN